MRIFSGGWILLATALIAGGCGKNDNPAPPAPAPAPAAAAPAEGSGNFATAPLDYVKTLVTNQQKATKVIDVTSLNKDIELFNVQEGRNPTNLNELVAKKYIGALPMVPTGMKLLYDPAQGKVTIAQQ